MYTKCAPSTLISVEKFLATSWHPPGPNLYGSNLRAFSTITSSCVHQSLISLGPEILLYSYF